jgi:hypothetical protein
MSRYLLLFLLNLPFILAALLSQITQYKLGRSTKKRFQVQMLLWFLILIGLATAQPIYIWLFSNGLTQTESLSLFDVVQITAIVITFYIANRSRLKVEVLEHRLKDLHQELSIQLAKTQGIK